MGSSLSKILGFGEKVSYKTSPRSAPPATSTIEQAEGHGFQPRNMFAFIIGIDKYKHYESKYHLKGAVQDAKDFRTYLQNLGVPSEQIYCLLDSQATRKGIMDGFKCLIKGKFPPRSKPIPRNSGLLIFYAGHGGSEDIPKAWQKAGYTSSSGRVEQLLPADTRKPKIALAAIAGIPDRTIDAVLKLIEQRIGDNITVIFDCCHSGSLTREDLDSDRGRARQLDDIPKLSAKWDDAKLLEQDLNNDNSAAVRGMRPSVSTSSFESHVLLAACREKQLAKETQRHGHFTLALLKVLRDLDSESRLTYKELLQRIDLKDPWQTPIALGINLNRYIFTTLNKPVEEDFFVGQLTRKNAYRIYGGLVHGVTYKSEFRLYSTSTTPEFLGTAKVEEVFSVSAELIATMAEPEELTEEPTEEPKKPEELRCQLVRDFTGFTVYCDTNDDTWMRDILSFNRNEQISRASKTEDASVIMELGGNDTNRTVAFRFGGMEGGQSTKTIPTTCIDDIHIVLKAMHRFHAILSTTPDAAVSDAFAIEFHSLGPKVVKQDRIKHIHWVSNGIVKLTPSQMTGVLEVTLNKSQLDNSKYGIVVKKRKEFKTDFFAYVLRFNVDDLSIEPCYVPHSGPSLPFAGKEEGNVAPKIDAEINDEHELKVGFGEDDHHITFNIPSGEDECTYFKIFLAVSPTDITPLLQAPPAIKALPTDQQEIKAIVRGEAPETQLKKGKITMTEYTTAVEQKLGNWKDYYACSIKVRQTKQG